MLNIIHYADIQIELRVSGENAQRYLEFSSSLNSLEQKIRDTKPDIVVIAGDIYQYADTNGEEQEMFSDHLHAILPHTKRIIIIPGNHDIKQKNNTIIKEGEKTSIGDSIRSIVSAIKSDKISYYSHTGLYKDSVFDITWAVWSQISKHSALDPKPAYSPWVENEYPTGNVIELFHDPIRNAKNFSGEPDETFKKYGIGLEDFKANTILAGDIHNPDIIWFGENNERVFSYSSSLVQRNFGEGDYYTNEVKRVSGNSKHGYNFINFDETTNKTTLIEFYEIKNEVSRHTYNLSKSFDYSDINIRSLVSSIPSSSVSPQIRIIASGNLSKYVESQKDFESAFYTKFKNCNLSLECTSDIILEQENLNIDILDIESALDRTKIIALSTAYIHKLVDSTSTIEKDDKAEAKTYITELFVDEFNKHTFEQVLNKIDLLDFHIDNFMNFDEATVAFKNNTITRISGTNGIGKTKLWSFLAWLFTDSITSNQNAKEKTYNYSLFFNDSSEKDEVIGTCKFKVNGILHILEKKMTRDWKKNSKDISKHEWYKNLKSAPSVEYTLRIHKSSTNVEELKNDEVVEFLKNLIGTFKNFEKFTFIDAVKLRELINRDNSYLIQEVLDAMGLTIIDNLLESYSKIKDEKLDALKKPEFNSKEYQTMIDFEIANIETYRLSKENFETKIADLNVIIQKNKESIEKLEATRHQVKNEQTLLFEIEELKNDNKSYQEIIDSANLLINQPQDEVDYTVLLDKLQKDLTVANVALSEIKTNISNKETSIEKIKGLQKDLLNDCSSKWHADNAEISLKITENASKIEKLENAKTLEIYAFIEALQKDFDAKAIIVKSLTEELVTTNDKLLSIRRDKAKEQSLFDEQNRLRKIYQDNLDSLTSTEGKCQSCGSKLVDEKLETYNKLIEVEKLKISEVDNYIKELQLKIDEIQIEEEKSDKIRQEQLTKLSEAENNLAGISELKAEASGSRILIHNDIVNADKYFENVEKYNLANIELSAENAKLSESISSEKLRPILLDFIATDKEYLKYAEELVNINSDIVTESAKINTIVIEISELTDKIEEATKKRNEKTLFLENLQLEKNKIIEVTSLISANNKRIETIETLELQLAKLNVETDAAITKNRVEIDNTILAISEEEKQKQSNTFEITKSQEKINEYEIGINQYRQYRIAEASLKLYKKLLSRDGLPQHIFASILPIINRMLNDNLSSVDFRLMFHPEYLDLIFIDTAKNASRPIQFISGMQETIVGLAITGLLISLNQATKYNFMFIDEISGKVTDGSQLTYSSKNYKKILMRFIEDLSKTINLFIIDPVLVYDNERVLEVQPSENGSVVQELSYALK